MEDKTIEIIITLPKPMQAAALRITDKVILLLEMGQGKQLREVRDISNTINGMLLAMEEMGLTKLQCVSLLNTETKALVARKGHGRPMGKTATHIN